MADAPPAVDPQAALQTIAPVEASAHDVADSAALMLRTLETSLQTVRRACKLACLSPHPRVSYARS